MKANELKDKSVDDLKKMLIDTLQTQFNLRMQRGMGQQVKPHSFSKIRRNIAQLKTLIHQKGLVSI